MLRQTKSLQSLLERCYEIGQYHKNRGRTNFQNQNDLILQLTMLTFTSDDVISQLFWIIDVVFNATGALKPAAGAVVKDKPCIELSKETIVWLYPINNCPCSKTSTPSYYYKAHDWKAMSLWHYHILSPKTEKTVNWTGNPSMLISMSKYSPVTCANV